MNLKKQVQVPIQIQMPNQHKMPNVANVIHPLKIKVNILTLQLESIEQFK